MAHQRTYMRTHRMPTAHQRAYPKLRCRRFTTRLLPNSDILPNSDTDGSPTDLYQPRMPMAHQWAYTKLRCRLAHQWTCDERSYKRNFLDRRGLASFTKDVCIFCHTLYYRRTNVIRVRMLDAECLVPARGNRPRLATCRYWATFNSWDHLTARLYSCALRSLALGLQGLSLCPLPSSLLRCLCASCSSSLWKPAPETSFGVRIRPSVYICPDLLVTNDY
jgi:hypothetical protein